ncbi:hypothetical protein D3C81_901790 [compost metagenome]
MQQHHARLVREALDHFTDHAPRQLRALHAQRQTAEFLPGLQIFRDGIGVDQLAQHLRRDCRITPAGRQRQQRVAPGAGFGGMQHRQQFLARQAGIALAHGQRSAGGTYRDRARIALRPERQRLAGTGIVAGQHGDAGGPFGQSDISLRLLRGLQIPACRVGQLAGLQRKLPGQHRGHGACCLSRHGRRGGPRRGRQHRENRQGKQQNAAYAMEYGHLTRPGRKMAAFNSQQLIASN